MLLRSMKQTVLLRNGYTFSGHSHASLDYDSAIKSSHHSVA